MVRLLGIVLASALNFTVAADASAQSNGNNAAYQYALKCWSVAGYLASDPTVKNDPDRLAAAKAGGKKAFDAAVRMGGILGYSSSQIETDLDTIGRTEGELMLRDRTYFDRNRAVCEKLGLM